MTYQVINKNELQLTPVLFTEVGKHNMEVVLYDGGNATTRNPMVVTILNFAPVFTKKPKDWRISMNHTLLINLGDVKD